MSDPREALLALLRQADHAPMSTHDPRDGSCQSCPWPLHEMPPEDIADAILAAGWTPPTVKPSVEDVARVLFDAEYHDIDATERNIAWGIVNGTDYARKHGTAWHRQARAVLALLPGRSEAEAKAEALRKAAPGCNCEDDYAWLNDRADRIERGEGRG